MKTSIATVSLSGTLGEKLEAIANAKFDAVEIFENDLITFNGAPADVRRACAELGLDIVTLQPFRDFEGMPPGRRERAMDRAERKFDVMQELGTDLLMICSNVAPESLGGIDRAAADLRELGERAARRGLRIAFEALAWGRHINDYRDAWEAVRRADHPAVGLVLDSFHILARGTDLGAIRAIPGDRIFLVQLADAPLLQMDYLSWSRHFRNFPGQGELPVLDFMEALSATGYDGALSLEIFNDQFRAGSARSLAVDGHRSLRFLLDQLAERTGKRPAGTPVLPPRSQAKGVGFIEFSADDDDAARLEELLAGLGFRRAGRHRSKAVTRWCQGDINLVVNREKEGFAHSFNIVHGSAVCALGLTVDDAAATFERATLLLDRAVPPGRRAGRARHPGGARRGRQPGLFPRFDQRARPRLGHRVRRHRRDRQRRRPHHRRSHLAVDAVRGDADLAAVLHLAARSQEDPAPGRGRSGRPGAQPGGRGARRRAAHRAQRLAKPAHAIVALPHRAVRLGRSAHRLRHRRPFGDRGSAGAERRAPARHPGELLRRPFGQDRPAGRSARHC